MDKTSTKNMYIKINELWTKKMLTEKDVDL